MQQSCTLNGRYVGRMESAAYIAQDFADSFSIGKYQGIKIINTPDSAFRAYVNKFVRGSFLITISEDNPEDFTSEVITVNEPALTDSEYSEAADISPVEAFLWVALEKFLFLLKKHFSP